VSYASSLRDVDDLKQRLVDMWSGMQQSVIVGEDITASFISELLKIRDNYLDYPGIFHLDQSDIATLIDYVVTV